jgi:hypothetical protein
LNASTADPFGTGTKLAHGMAAAAHRADESYFACRAGAADPVGVGAGADQITPPFLDEQLEKGLVAKLEGIVGLEFVHMDYGEAIAVLDQV